MSRRGRNDGVRLREPTGSDLAAFERFADDPEFAFFWRSPEGQAASKRSGARHLFAVEHGNELVGLVSLRVSTVDRTADLGYAVARPYWGRGIATEAARRVVDHAFDELRLEKVWCHIDPRNVASVRVAEKLGMQLEGRLRKHVVRRGERVDRLCYGLLATERGRPGAAARRRASRS